MKKSVMLLLFSLLVSGCGGSDFEWFPDTNTADTTDTTAPTVSALIYYTENGRLTARIESLTATDNVAVTGYLITETATVPTAADAAWSGSVPTTHTFATATNTILYAWAKDAAGNVSAAKSFSPAYTLQRTIKYPAGVVWVADIAYDKNSTSFWLLTGTSGPPPNALVKINASGQLMTKLDADGWPFSIADGSSLAFDGSTFWITSNGYDNSVTPAVPRSEIYRMLNNGVVASYYATYPCPATDSGFCQGLAWDGTSFWAAGSDNGNLVNFQVAGVAISSAKTYPGLWQTNGVSDIGFDSVGGQLLVLKDGLITVDRVTGSLVGSKKFTLPGTGKGDWDGSLFWVVDNVNKELKGLAVK